MEVLWKDPINFQKEWGWIIDAVKIWIFEFNYSHLDPSESIRHYAEELSKPCQKHSASSQVAIKSRKQAICIHLY